MGIFITDGRSRVPQERRGGRKGSRAAGRKTASNHPGALPAHRPVPREVCTALHRTGHEGHRPAPPQKPHRILQLLPPRPEEQMIRITNQYCTIEITSTLASLSDSGVSLAMESLMRLGLGGGGRSCETGSDFFWEGVLTALEGELLAILLEVASLRCWVRPLSRMLEGCSSSPSLRRLISSSHSLNRSTVTSIFSSQMVQVYLHCTLKSILQRSTSFILSQFQISKVLGLISTQLHSQSWLSQSILMALEMSLTGCLSLRRRTQQELMFLLPPQTSLPSFTSQTEFLFIIIMQRQFRCHHTNLLTLSVTISSYLMDVACFFATVFFFLPCWRGFITRLRIRGVVSCCLFSFFQPSLRLPRKQPDPRLISSIFLTFGEWMRQMHFRDMPPNLMPSSRAALQEFLRLKESTSPRQVTV